MSASGNIRLHLMRYVNRDGRDIDGDRCDTTMGIKTSDCDPYFKLCIGDASNSDCSIASLQSAVYRDSNSVNFGTSFGRTTNPLNIPFSTWPKSGVRIKIQVYDEDSRSDDDLIDNLETIISDTPSPSVTHAVTREVLIRGKTQLFGGITVYCDESWYGDDCGHHCSPQDDDTRGHFTCSQTGEIICLPGWEGDHCTENIDECASDPCHNDGLCSDGINSFRCQCKDGYTDTLCQTDIDECLSNPCLNGATCDDVINGFRCLCLPHYTGMLCDVDICADVICLNGGLCEPVSGSATCSCQPGYYGTRCESEKNECQSNPCQGEGSTCTDLLDGFRCTCTEGRTGVTCSELLYPETTSLPVDAMTSPASDPCSGLPCNGGRCEPVGTSYVCHCPPGYTGVDCSVDLCGSGTVCGELGTCVPTESGYICQCPDGTSGHHCTTSVASCSDVTCLNGGECHDLDGAVTCKCSPGYKGERCQFVISLCVSNPCLHGATCTENSDGYTCICPDSYRGDHCEDRIQIHDPDSQEVLLFIGDLDHKDIVHLEQAILDLAEKNEDDTQNRQYQMIYDTHKCQGEDGISVTVFTFQIFDGADDVISGNRLKELIGQLTGEQRDVILPQPLYNGTDCTVATSVGRSTDFSVRPFWPLVVGIVGAALVIGIIASLVIAYTRRKSRSGGFDVITNPLYDSGERRGTSDTVLSVTSVEQSKPEVDQQPVYFRSHSGEYPAGACAVDQ